MINSDRIFKTVQAAYPDWKIDSLSWNGNKKQSLMVEAIAPDSKDEAGVNNVRLSPPAPKIGEARFK
ncbi:MAG TPA: hypothetical protein V6C71_03230 [Coleofasciculaceae cyanobacterium]|jgi:hypothetical protein